MPEPVITPTAPPVPTPTPTPAPAPSPTPAAPPEPVPPSDNPFQEVFDKAEAHIKKMNAELAKPAPKVDPKPEPAPKQEAPKPQPKQDQPKPKSEPHKLRDELDARTAELNTFKESHAKLESKLKELETKGQDTSKVLERISQLEKERDERVKENEELKNRLHVVRLEEDPKFKEEYDDKFNKYAAVSKNFVERLDIIDAEGNPIRKADWTEDFAKIYHIYKDTPRPAIEILKTRYGVDIAALLVPRMEKLQDIETDRANRVSELQAKASELRRQEESQTATRKQQVDQLWVQVNKELQEKNPDFVLDPTDAELAEARNDALRIFDGKPKDDQQRIVKNAYIRQMIGVSPVQKLKIARLTKENAALKAELESFKNPAPPPGKHPTSGAPTTDDPNESWSDRAKRELAGI